jgi:hypothetical protein
MINHFGRHQASHRLNRALALLAEHGLVRYTTSPAGGRPEQRWFAASRCPGPR